MEMFCINCEIIVEHVAISDVIKDKKLNVKGYYYWRRLKCKKCGWVRWFDVQGEQNEMDNHQE